MNEDIEKESAVKLLEETDKNISEVREKIASVKLSIKNCKLTDYERNEFIQNQEVALNNLNRVFSGLSSKQNTLLMRIRSEVRSGEKAQQGELFTLVANKARSSGKPNAYYWSRFQNHFHLSSYKLTPADKFDEALDYLDRLEGENNPLLTLSQDELNERIAKGVEAMKGELLPKDETIPTDTITISLNNGIRMMNIVFGGTADTVQRYSVSVDKEFLSIHQMDNKLMADVLKDQGYIVFDKTGVSARQIVMHHIPPQFLPDMIEEAGAMLRRINEGKKLD